MNRDYPRSEFSNELPPIPEESVEGWKEKPIKGIKQELVPLGPFAEFSDCDTSAVYFGERGSGTEMDFVGQVTNFSGQKVNRKESLLTHFVRKDVADHLRLAQTALPKGYYFKFYDGFRSFGVQQELYAAQKKVVEKQHPDWSPEQVDEETHKFIARPKDDEESRTKRPSPHTTGAAIDLRLIRLNEQGQQLLAALEQKKISGDLGSRVKPEEQKAFDQMQEWVEGQDLSLELKENWLLEYRYGVQKALIFREHSELVDTGTGFDDFSAQAKTNYYETLPQESLSAEDLKRRDNRRLLYSVMNSAGFLSYPEEWWHFSYGDQEWAANKNQSEALFGEVDLSEQNKATEKARRLVYLKTIRRVKNAAELPFIES